MLHAVDRRTNDGRLFILNSDSEPFHQLLLRLRREEILFNSVTRIIILKMFHDRITYTSTIDIRGNAHCDSTYLFDSFLPWQLPTMKATNPATNVETNPHREVVLLCEVPSPSDRRCHRKRMQDFLDVLQAKRIATIIARFCKIKLLEDLLRKIALRTFNFLGSQDLCSNSISRHNLMIRITRLASLSASGHAIKPILSSLNVSNETHWPASCSK